MLLQGIDASVSPALKPYRGHEHLSWSDAWPGFSAVRFIASLRPEDGIDLVNSPRLNHVLRHVGWSPLPLGATAVLVDAEGFPCASAVLMSYYLDPPKASQAQISSGAPNGSPNGSPRPRRRARRKSPPAPLTLGLNLSYIVREDHRGLGLGRLVSNVAAVSLMRDLMRRENPAHALQWLGDSMFSAQCHESNADAHRLAAKLGLRADQRLAFEVPTNERTQADGAAGLRYIGFSMPAETYLQRAWEACTQPLAQAIQGALPIGHIEAQKCWAASLLGDTQGMVEPAGSRQSQMAG